MLFVSLYNRELGNITTFAMLLFDECDVGHKGYLTKSEFLKFTKMANVHHRSSKDFDEEYEFYDENGDGKITFDEIISSENTLKADRDEYLD
ncbi:hypothetical protein GPJ56_010017 [Histomonas meleagridis]|uniref:uncharacterized protein n=1 Tax=Histomonas meleagridis TaxID=135588 RepID=UPI003559E879|nr:hypothetical protein GPJ56_010017 [Histomonas meleagridis]KAH0799493.1 hypothetical protein GO595_007688 [Histomonas meleagridis]